MANIDYEEKLTQVDAEKQQALTEAEQTYGGMISEAQKYYQNQIDTSKEWAEKQQELQKAQTDFTIEQINQQKAQTKKDYTKEQSGAYVDYTKESNRYGAGAEEMAAAGLSDTGYSESSQVSMYNEYQNRVATARASYNQVVMNYDNAIKEAQLQNSSALAEIAYTALQQQTELLLQGFQYENQLIFALEDRKTQIEETYRNQYLDVLDQMNTENALAEQARQYNQNYELQVKEYEEGVRQFKEQMERLKAQDEEEKRQFDIRYGDSSENAIIDKQKDTGSSSFTGKVFPTLGKTMENKEITNFIESVLKDPIREQSGKEGSTAEKSQTVEKSQDVIGKTIKGHIGEIVIPTPVTANVQGINTGTKLAQEIIKNKIAIVDTIAAKKKYEVATDYYRGALSDDAKTFGTFKNGYQPKGINGHGTLEKTGETTTIERTVMYGTKKGKKVELTQNIWKAEDGTRWIWDGKHNCYVPEL